MAKKKTDKKEEKIGEALIKVALGYQIAEVTEEYAEVDGELKLTKRKKTKKDVPPDLKAVQLLLASEGEEYAQWSDEALEAEKQRLLGVLQEAENGQSTGKGTGKDRKQGVKKGMEACGLEATRGAGEGGKEKPREKKENGGTKAVRKTSTKPRKRVEGKTKAGK